MLAIAQDMLKQRWFLDILNGPMLSETDHAINYTPI